MRVNRPARARGVAMEQDHGSMRIGPRHQPGLQRDTTSAPKHVPLVRQPDVGRRSPVLRTRHAHAVDQDFDGLGD